MKIKAVFLDFDNTLGNREEAAYNTYKQALEPLHIEDPYELEAVLQACMVFDQGGETNKNYVMQRVEKEFGLKWPYEDFNDWWECHLFANSFPFEGTYETIAALKAKGIKIGIITNGGSEPQNRKVDAAGLRELVDDVFVSADVQAWKPDPQLFNYAMEKLGVKPEESVMVGDIFAKDVLGAHRAGMHAVWFNHSIYRPCHVDMEVIRSIREVPEVIERMEQISDKM